MVAPWNRFLFINVRTDILSATCRRYSLNKCLPFIIVMIQSHIKNSNFAFQERTREATALITLRVKILSCCFLVKSVRGATIRTVSFLVSVQNHS